MKKQTIKKSSFQKFAHLQITGAKKIKGGTDSEIIIVDDSTVG